MGDSPDPVKAVLQKHYGGFITVRYLCQYQFLPKKKNNNLNIFLMGGRVGVAGMQDNPTKSGSIKPYF